MEERYRHNNVKTLLTSIMSDEGNIDITELVKYLESGDLEIIREITQVVYENLNASKDATIFNGLFDTYLRTKSSNLLEILAGVNERHCQYLFDRMNELIKASMFIETTSLFAALIRRQPSWLYKIVGSVFFTQYLKILKAETDVVFVMSGAVIIGMLLPCVPSLVAPFLGEVLEIFIRMASFMINKPGSLPDVLILHLQIGVYILFQRLYSMYPNNFLSYIRSCFGSNSSDPVFRHVIEPMLQFVKFHSGLVCDTLKSETENSKWKTSQPHDIYAECRKISLDPLDAIKEATYTVFSSSSPASGGIYPKRTIVVGSAVGTDSASTSKTKYKADKEVKKDDICSDCTGNNKSIPYLSSQDLSLQWSPSFMCELSTPPSSRPLSPANSNQDIISMNEFVQRPMTPVSAFESKDTLNYSDDTCTSTPILSRRSSGDDYKTHSNKFFSTVALNRKTKSEDSIEQAGGNKGDGANTETLHVSHNKTPPNTPLTKSTGLEKKKSSIHSSPRLQKREKLSSKRAAESSSAPSTPAAVVSKNSFPFVSNQGSNHACYATNRPTTTISDGNRSRSLIDKNDSFLNEISVNLLKVIQDLQLEDLKKPNGSQECHEDFAYEAEHFTNLKFKSPFELLDEFIDCGSNLHSLQLSRIPITSQMDTDWTYFGGYTPADELTILRAQVNLLEVQLHYERQKCNEHVIRNRRLVGKVHKAQAFEDELAAMKNRVGLLEAELYEAQVIIKDKDEDIKNLREFKDVLEKEKTQSLKLYSDENRSLKYKIQELSAELSAKDFDASLVGKELTQAKSDLFNARLEINLMKPRLEINNTAKARAENLSKELVTLKERHDMAKRHFRKANKSHGERFQQSILIDALKNEIKDLKISTEDIAATLDAARLKISELEATLAKKEMAIRDQKANMESLCRKHDQNIQILEERYRVLKKASQGMESYILYLLKKVEDSNRRLHSHGSQDAYQKSDHVSVIHSLDDEFSKSSKKFKNEEHYKSSSKRSKRISGYGGDDKSERNEKKSEEIDKKLVDDSGIESNDYKLQLE